MTNQTITLCFFCYNELNGLKYTINILKKKYNILVIDGGSNDGSREFLKKQKIKFIIQKKKDYNNAYYLGVKNTRTKHIIIFHPKKTFSINTIYKIEKKLKSGFDLVFTTRMTNKAYNEEDKNILKPRKWFGIGLAIVTKFFFKKRKQNNLTDPLCGVRGFNVKKFKSLGLNKNGVTADLEFFINAFNLRFSFIEIPIIEKSRLYGKTNFPAIKTGTKIIFFLINAIFRKIFL